MRPQWPITRALAGLLLALLQVGLLPEGTLAADRAPGFTAERVDGNGTLSLDDLRGEVVLLNIWATWCGPCKREMPELQHLSETYAADGLRVIGISVDVGGANERIQQFADDLGVTFDLVRDESGDISRDYRTSGVPETILIDRGGNIVRQWKGELKAGDPEMRHLIETALASEAAVDLDDVPRVAAIGFVAAFVAGFLSVLSPCVFPLIPTYASYITGVSADELSRQDEHARRRTRRVALRNGLLFVAGFSLVFVAMGASASAIGGLLHEYRDWIARIGGVLLLVMGLHMLGVFRIAALDRIIRPSMGSAGRAARPAGTFLVGVAFGAGWTPCIGPALASILTLAAATASMREGMVLLAIYALGLAVPFLLGTVLIDRFMLHRAGFGPWIPRLEKISAVLIVAIGLLMVTGALSRLSSLSANWSLV